MVALFSPSSNKSASPRFKLKKALGHLPACAQYHRNGGMLEGASALPIGSLPHFGLQHEEPIRVMRGAAHTLGPRYHTAYNGTRPLALQQRQRAVLDPALVLDEEERAGARLGGKSRVGTTHTLRLPATHRDTPLAL